MGEEEEEEEEKEEERGGRGTRSSKEERRARASFVNKVDLMDDEEDDDGGEEEDDDNDDDNSDDDSGWVMWNKGKQDVGIEKSSKNSDNHSVEHLRKKDVSQAKGSKRKSTSKSNDAKRMKGALEKNSDPRRVADFGLEGDVADDDNDDDDNDDDAVRFLDFGDEELSDLDEEPKTKKSSKKGKALQMGVLPRRNTKSKKMQSSFASFEDYAHLM